MRDDFAALDLLSATRTKPAKRKKLLGLPRRKVKKSTQEKSLGTAFQPLIAKIKKKQKTDAVDTASLQGWPVSLSWSAPRPAEGDDASQAYPLGHSS